MKLKNSIIKDIEGNIVNVGDRVIAYNMTYGMFIGIVVKSHSAGCTVESMTGYSTGKDGKTNYNGCSLIEYGHKYIIRESKQLLLLESAADWSRDENFNRIMTCRT